ncbi:MULTISPECIES: aldo/keto reductase [Halomonadaceae]|uniref:Aldo/keto reductase n=1 Tax=Vreelandella halophila TaxID=86177 RepID=A0A9X4YCZ9_9GAMM|nr:MULTISPECIES: aldo/keto reductase [Halomonas]MYL25640.1 aldo/keto reductase [Halomonas utahensis]MYL74876.1 aldo/keto reductase [Halomonas sp. 22501_18_FS]
MVGYSRRRVLGGLGAGLAVAAWPGLAAAAGKALNRAALPNGGGSIPVIGMGTWRTFNVGGDPELREARTQVLAAFFEEGGGLIDSSPMYGSAQSVLGHGLEKLGYPDSLFAADKVWTRDGGATREQAAESSANWGLERFDLLQVHNLLAWEAHLETLQAMKEAGEVGAIGITTSHGRRLDQFERIMERHELDFIQLTYNIRDRWAEDRILPLAREKGIAVIANRPYQGGSLIRGVQRRGTPLPDWADEIDCRTWADFLLKFIVSHPAVTCAIPATTSAEHVRENMAAGRGIMPDAAQRQRMIEALAEV